MLPDSNPGPNWNYRQEKRKGNKKHPCCLETFTLINLSKDKPFKNRETSKLFMLLFYFTRQKSQLSVPLNVCLLSEHD